jgi:hypothetical protein
MLPFPPYAAYAHEKPITAVLYPRRRASDPSRSPSATPAPGRVCAWAFAMVYAN